MSSGGYARLVDICPLPLASILSYPVQYNVLILGFGIVQVTERMVSLKSKGAFMTDLVMPRRPGVPAAINGQEKRGYFGRAEHGGVVSRLVVGLARN